MFDSVLGSNVCSMAGCGFAGGGCSKPVSGGRRGLVVAGIGARVRCARAGWHAAIGAHDGPARFRRAGIGASSRASRGGLGGLSVGSALGLSLIHI